jgi:hypothetical protein
MLKQNLHPIYIALGFILMVLFVVGVLILLDLGKVDVFVGPVGVKSKELAILITNFL